MMLRAIEGLPVNFGLYGKGQLLGSTRRWSSSSVAGAAGFKVHEDYGSTPAAIRAALTIADDFDVSVAVHTDTLNEAGYVEDTIAAFDGRTIHTYHSEGAGGGHAPDLLKVVGQPNVLPSSTNPTLPCGQNSVAELFDMIMVCHNLNPKIPSDVAFAESRVRAETIVAESVLHDMGAISMIGSDSQAMGRIGENFLRALQTADAMKQARGALPEDAPGNDNFRVLRYVAKVTINPAIAAGISTYVGSIEPGKMADLVLWEPAFFGAKPKMVLKGGAIVWANMGDPNASLADAAADVLPPDVRCLRRHAGAKLIQLRVPGGDRGEYRREIRASAPVAAGHPDPGGGQGAHGAQRLPTQHRGQSPDLRCDRGWGSRDGAAAEDHLAQSSLFLQLSS